MAGTQSVNSSQIIDDSFFHSSTFHLLLPT